MLRLGLAAVLLAVIATILACASAPPPARPLPDAIETAHRFLQALAEGRYPDLWAMMAPTARQEWPEDTLFADYLGRKFGGFSLAYTLGDLEARSSWTDASGTTWPKAALIPVSLALDGQALPAFQGLTLVLVQMEGSWRVLEAGPAARSAPLLLPPAPAIETLAVPILAYHHVAQQEPADSQQITMTVTTTQLEEELAYLKEAGYQTIPLRQLFEALYYGVALPSKPVILTFDDGYADAYTEALPLLQKYGFGATFAIPTGLVGQPGYLTWKQIKAMAAAGMELISHSVSHVDLASIPTEEATRELRLSKRALEEALGRPMQFLVYPYGEPFAHYGPEAQQATIELLRQEGYVLGVSNPLPGEPPDIVQEAEAPYRLSRVNVPGRMPLVRFIARLEGSDPYLG